MPRASALKQLVAIFRISAIDSVGVTAIAKEVPTAAIVEEKPIEKSALGELEAVIGEEIAIGFERRDVRCRRERRRCPREWPFRIGSKCC